MRIKFISILLLIIMFTMFSSCTNEKPKQLTWNDITKPVTLSQTIDLAKTPTIYPVGDNKYFTVYADKVVFIERDAIKWEKNYSLANVEEITENGIFINRNNDQTNYTKLDFSGNEILTLSGKYFKTEKLFEEYKNDGYYIFYIDSNQSEPIIGPFQSKAILGIYNDQSVLLYYENNNDYHIVCLTKEGIAFNINLDYSLFTVDYSKKIILHDNILYFAQDGHLTAYDKNGEIIYEKTGNTYDLIKAFPDYLLTINYNSNPYLGFVKLAKDGRVLAEFGSDQYYEDYYISDDGTIYLKSDGHIIKIDQDGNVQYNKELSFQDVLYHSNNAFIAMNWIGSEHKLIELNQAGNEVRNEVYKYLEKINNENNLILFYQTDTESGIIIYDQAGNRLSKTKIGGIRIFNKTIIINPDQSAFIYYQGSENNKALSQLLKISKEGNIIFNISTPHRVDVNKITLFSDGTFLEAQVNFLDSTYYLYDNQGNLKNNLEVMGELIARVQDLLIFRDFTTFKITDKNLNVLFEGEFTGKRINSDNTVVYLKDEKNKLYGLTINNIDLINS